MARFSPRHPATAHRARCRRVLLGRALTISLSRSVKAEIGGSPVGRRPATDDEEDQGWKTTLITPSALAWNWE